MNNKKECRRGDHLRYKRGHNRNRRGPSSFHMHDPELIFSKLKLKQGDSFLDLGCGVGDYSIYASKILGDSGLVYALDIWQEVVDKLAEEAASQGLGNIKTMVSDINNSLAIEAQCIDICFVATVLHTLNLPEVGKKLFNEIHRVLKADGCLAIIECKKEDMPFGPPIQMRISAKELEKEISQYGFEKLYYVDLGYNYMLQFLKNGR